MGCLLGENATGTRWRRLPAAQAPLCHPFVRLREMLTLVLRARGSLSDVGV